MYINISGDLIVFTCMGNIKSQLDLLEKTLTNSTLPPELLANLMITFMARRLFSHLKFPYTYFPSCNVTSYMLFDLLWEAVNRLERCGFKVHTLQANSKYTQWNKNTYNLPTLMWVLGSTTDGASINLRLVRLHNLERRLTHKTLNPCVTEGREFFFISDPPHLIKTTRKCWAS